MKLSYFFDFEQMSTKISSSESTSSYGLYFTYCLFENLQIYYIVLSFYFVKTCKISKAIFGKSLYVKVV